jgi:predicted cupin superfamily sugar epimerase
VITPEELKVLLGLKPLPIEGGFYTETYRSSFRLSRQILGDNYKSERSLSTAIYYLLTPDTFSALHKLPTDEIYHFYLGDPIEMLELNSDGTGGALTLGSSIEEGMKVQHCVRACTWQGSKLVRGGRWALLGTTMAPGFAFDDFEPGQRDHLTRLYPQFRVWIEALTR